MGILYDTPQSYMRRAESEQAAATGWMNEANRIAAQGVQDARNASAAANADFGKASGLVNQGVAAYNGLDPHIAAIGSTAAQVNATAQGLTPYAAMLRSYSEQLAGNARPLLDYGNGVLGDAAALRSLDPNAGGIVGRYIGNLNQFSPDRYVAMAAANVQGSADNAWAQLKRNSARQGGGANGSGNQAALQEQWARDTAALLAGAKTRAYQTGLTEQTSALRAALADALSMGNSGVSAISAGNTALGSAASAASGAANVIQQKGNLEVASGNLQHSAGGLQAQKAAGLVSAANAQNATASGRISAANLGNAATQHAISAAISAAQQHGNFASGWASTATSVDTMQALGIESGMSTYEKNKYADEHVADGVKSYTFGNEALRAL